MAPNKFESLSRFLSYVLRHAPQEFGLVLDQNGFVSLDKLLVAMHAESRWRWVRKEDLLNLVASLPRRRFEIRDGQIRALYGHTTLQTMVHEEAIPPEYLFHGTARRFSSHIECSGLLPARRAFVHLSRSIEDALAVGKRRDRNPVVYRILALTAHNQGIRFYRAGDVYLSRFIPAKHLQRLNLVTLYFA